MGFQSYLSFVSRGTGEEIACGPLKMALKSVASTREQGGAYTSPVFHKRRLAQCPPFNEKGHRCTLFLFFKLHSDLVSMLIEGGTFSNDILAFLFRLTLH